MPRPAITTAPGPGPVLLDVTRLVASRWAGRPATGIDRVCLAYLRHFAPRARAVVQHRGLVRTFSPSASAALFALLDTPSAEVRRGLVRQLAAALATPPARTGLEQRAYLNIGHTDFDLAAHHAWVRGCGVRPFYFLHDLIPVLHPHFTRPHAVRRHLGRVLGALNGAAGIILPSQAVRSELEAFAAARGLPLPPVQVAHLAGENLAAGAETPAAAVPEPFFLCIGTIEPRKNHALLLALWQRLVGRLGADAPRLVLVGQTGPLTRDLLAPLAASAPLRAAVVHLTSCSDAELAGLVRGARAVLVPSLAEGFGLPLVEALAAGAPVIASDLPVFREISQGAARLIDPADLDAWEQAILAALARPDRTAPRFDPSRWPAHFELVECFISAEADLTRRSSERGLAA